MPGTFQSDINIVDTDNSSSTPLIANGIFTGNFVKVTDYSSITITCNSDVGSKFSGLRIEWSTDGVSVLNNIAPQLFTFDPVVVSQDGFTVHATVRGPYYRVIYENNASDPQTFFVLSSLLRKGTPAGTVRSLDPTNTFITNVDVEVVQSVLSGAGFQNPEQIQFAQLDDTEILQLGSFLFVSPRPIPDDNINRNIVAATLIPTELSGTGQTVGATTAITNDVLRGNLYIQLGTITGLSTTVYDYKIPPGHTWIDHGQFGSTYVGHIYGVWDEVYIQSVPIQEGHARIVRTYFG